MRTGMNSLSYPSAILSFRKAGSFDFFWSNPMASLTVRNIAVILALFAICSSVRAADITWDGGGGCFLSTLR